MLAPVLALALAANPRIAVMPINPGAAVAPPEAAAMTDALVSEVRRRGVGEVITQAEISSILSIEQQKRMLGCSSDACIAELGGALGVGKLVTGNVAKLGESLLLHLRLIDTAKVRVVTQSDRRLKRGSYDDLLDILPVMVSELFPEAAPAAAPPQAASPPPKPPPAPAPAPAPYRLPDGMVAIHLAGSKPGVALLAWREEKTGGSSTPVRTFVTEFRVAGARPSGTTEFGPYWLLPASEFPAGKVHFGFLPPLADISSPLAALGTGPCGTSSWSLAESREVWMHVRSCTLHRTADEAIRTRK